MNITVIHTKMGGWIDFDFNAIVYLDLPYAWIKCTLNFNAAIIVS